MESHDRSLCKCSYLLNLKKKEKKKGAHGPKYAWNFHHYSEPNQPNGNSLMIKKLHPTSEPMVMVLVLVKFSQFVGLLLLTRVTTQPQQPQPQRRKTRRTKEGNPSPQGPRPLSLVPIITPKTKLSKTQYFAIGKASFLFIKGQFGAQASRIHIGFREESHPKG